MRFVKNGYQRGKWLQQVCSAQFLLSYLFGLNKSRLRSLALGSSQSRWITEFSTVEGQPETTALTLPSHDNSLIEKGSVESHDITRPEGTWHYAIFLD